MKVKIEFEEWDFDYVGDGEYWMFNEVENSFLKIKRIEEGKDFDEMKWILKFRNGFYRCEKCGKFNVLGESCECKK